MFREMTRKNKEIPRAACVDLLKSEKRGVLSVLGDDGYPYGMPMNHFYNEEDGCLYFHCGRQRSHRMDALRRDSRVSFCVMDQGHLEDGHWALHIQSVVVFGRMEVIDDLDAVNRISALLSRKFTQDEAYIQREIERSGRATLLLRLTPEHICGKRVTEE